jgi:hypothetical protein
MNEENMGANEGRNGEVKERVISFRLNPQEYAMVEGIASLDGEALNAWARKIVLDEARGEEGLSRKERVLLEEIARLGYLIEHGFGIQLSADRATDAEWRRREKESKSIGARLVKMMFERRAKGAGTG